MSAVADAMLALRAGIEAADTGARTYTDLGAVVDPPGVVIGPPTLTWGAPCSDPTTAKVLLYVVVASDDRAMPRLWDLLPELALAVESVVDAVVTTAGPGTWNNAGQDLPCYLLSVEMGLTT